MAVLHDVSRDPLDLSPDGRPWRPIFVTVFYDGQRFPPLLRNLTPTTRWCRVDVAGNRLTIDVEVAASGDLETLAIDAAKSLLGIREFASTPVVTELDG